MFKLGFKTTVNAAAGIASDMSTRAEFVDARQKSNTEVIFLGRIRFAGSLFARNYSDIRSGLVPTSMNHEHACRYWQEYHVAGSFAETLYSLSLTNIRLVQGHVKFGSLRDRRAAFALQYTARMHEYLPSRCERAVDEHRRDVN